MRYVPAACAAVFCLLLMLQPSRAFSEPLDLDNIQAEEPPEQLCNRLVGDPFVDFGPLEWARPFALIDPYRAVPACVKAMRSHPGKRGYILKAGLSFLAADKNEAGKTLLDRLAAKDDPSALLALAYIAPEGEAAVLMRPTSEQGNPTATMLLGMAHLTGKGVSPDQIEGARLLLHAAEQGSTRAMLLLANFHNEGAFGVGYNPEEAKRLIGEAARRGDPKAQAIFTGSQAASSGSAASH